MTATCTLCGVLLISTPDNILDSQRDDRTFGRLGATLRKHLNDCHPKTPQQVSDSPDLKGGTIGQLIGVAGITAQASAMFSYVQCEDPAFTLRIEKMKEIVEKAMEQKVYQPVQVPSVVVG